MKLQEAVRSLHETIESFHASCAAGVIQSDTVDEIECLLVDAEFHAFCLDMPTLENAPIGGRYTIPAARKFLMLIGASTASYSPQFRV